MPIISEAQYQQSIVEYAKLCGWLVYHTHDSRRSQPGFPDLTLCRPPRLILAEIKSTTGTLTPAQSDWLAALMSCNSVESYLWRPADWDDVQTLLR